MILLDANYFLRWFLNDIPSQNRQVVMFLNQAKPETIVLDRVTIAEITYVLRGQGYNHQQIAQALKEFCYQDSIQPLGKILSQALELYAATSLDLEDCWLATRARLEGAELATFDKQLLKHI